MERGDEEVRGVLTRFQDERDTDERGVRTHVLWDLCDAGVGEAHRDDGRDGDGSMGGVSVCDVPQGDDGTAGEGTANAGEHAVPGGRRDGAAGVEYV